MSIVNIGIVGSRRRNADKDLTLVTEQLYKIMKEKDSIISGGAHIGADLWAHNLAKLNGKRMVIHYPNFGYGMPACYFIRNTEIARESETLIACVSDDRTGGTEDTIKKFKKFHPNGELIIV